MFRIVRSILSIVFTFFSLTAWADSTSLLNQAKAANPTRYQFAVSNNAEIRNTSDNKAFTIWWQPTSSAPTGVIVNLHGHGSYATDGLYLWHSYLQARGYAILSLQWWFGGGETTADYYQPQEMYPIIASLLKEKGVKPGTVLFHGYSRGSANTYAVTALDTFSGNGYFKMTLSNSGGAASDYPPNQQIVAGDYGLLPFSGVEWVMYCGELDPDPTINGCPAMNAAKDWVIKYGATFKLLIEDSNGGHGGFQTNSTNVDTALAQFLPAVSQAAVEFYNAGINHYFMTAYTDEAASLDNKPSWGWARTAKTFNAWLTRASAPSNASPVCRFYGVFSNGTVGSHFYTVDATECAYVKSRLDWGWNYEGDAFYAVKPTGGVCPSGTSPIYRVYNNGMGGAPNHRYMTSQTDVATMVSQGWVSEGAAFCGSY